jgi:hypothetical protein
MMSKIGMGMPMSQSKIQPVAPASLIFSAKRIFVFVSFLPIASLLAPKARVRKITGHRSEVTSHKSQVSDHYFSEIASDPLARLA